MLVTHWANFCTSEGKKNANRNCWTEAHIFRAIIVWITPNRRDLLTMLCCDSFLFSSTFQLFIYQTFEIEFQQTLANSMTNHFNNVKNFQPLLPSKEKPSKFVCAQIMSPFTQERRQTRTKYVALKKVPGQSFNNAIKLWKKQRERERKNTRFTTFSTALSR